MGYWTELARHGAPGRGGANFPAWEPWDPVTEGLKTLQLDLPLDRIKLTPGRETVGAIAAEVTADAHLALLEKCRVLQAMATGIHAGDAEVTAAQQKLGCAQFQLASRPWGGLAP